jgi:ABC-type dipeptide/oligopeptide/nickel transport system permease component
VLSYIGRRILQFIPVFIGVTIVLFLVQSPALAGGDPLRMIAGERQIPDEVRATLSERFGLDKPLYVQYVRYMGRLFHGDLGESYQRQRPVTDILSEAFPNTLKLAAVAIVIEAVLGISAGILSAIKRYSFWDVLVTFTTSVLVALPVFFLGMGLQVLFGIKFKQWGLPYLPIQGMTGDGFGFWAHVILPAFTLAAVSMAYTARIMRSQLLEVQGQDYIRTASAKGLTGRQVVWRHSMRNAMIPVVTFLAIDLGVMVGGAILTETVFNWPGVGWTIYNAINNLDWPIVTGGTLIIVVMVMVINLLADISYAFMDPRIRYGNAASE